MKTSVKILSFILACSSVFFISCKKNDTAANSKNKNLSVFLTDDPSQYDSVLVDIRFVEVKVDTSDDHENDDHFGDNDKDDDDDNSHHDQFGKWDTLSIVPGVYNLAALRNGVNMTLGTGNIAGKVRKIRITLGSNNSVYKGNVKYPLSLFPGTKNYLYVKIHEEDEDDDNNNNNSVNSSIWIDFDLSRSVIEQNGQFYLKPVLKPFSKKHFGSIKGKVFPLDAHAVVNATNSQDVGNAIPERSGEYEIQGLHAGTYAVTFHSFNGYRDTTINSVVVSNGSRIVLPNITLRH
jgi:hypothetical protein